MSKRRKKPKPQKRRPAAPPKPEAGLQALYESASRAATEGHLEEARRIYGALAKDVPDRHLKALVCNDQATLATLVSDRESALQGFRQALAIDPQCEVARFNLTFLEDELAEANKPEAQAKECPNPSLALQVCVAAPTESPSAGKVAILSFLFNWPTSGGGNVHTAELARFLAKAGYAVRHFYPRYAAWGIGNVEGAPFPSEGLDFTEQDWNVPAIQARFRSAVDAFAPDFVIVMDSWSFKPHLAEAMRGYPVFLRFQALECLCPLNNVRLLVETDGRASQCPRQQLASPEACLACLRERGHQSGALHQAERALAGVGTPEYHRLLCRSLQEAEAVLALNPFTEAMLSPYARRVCVVPWGMDPARFPWPPPEEERPVTRLFMAALVTEYMKGFHVLHEACTRLWKKRQDFELVATGDPAGRVDEFTHFTGWASQEDLPRHYRETDITAVPTIAQEGLSRTSVEAMAAGKPVVASRIGGLPFTVADGATGLLCQPGDADDLARKLAVLLDDAELRRRMGLAGRRRFEEDFAWDVVIEKHYRPLFVKTNHHETHERHENGK
ncbi:MAG TPA: glycosyltransferase family 4 protein [Gemmataceae bacterium]|nr:glycosyltransferase family 4 protein [Gemmataceae bacterium]